MPNFLEVFEFIEIVLIFLNSCEENILYKIKIPNMEDYNEIEISVVVYDRLKNCLINKCAFYNIIYIICENTNTKSK